MAFIIFAAGCLESGKTKTQIVSKDMLKIKSIDIFPANTVQPEDAIIIRMEVENVGQESTYLLIDKDANTRGSQAELNPKWNGDYLLIDHCPSLYNANSKQSGVRDADFQILSGATCVQLYANPATPDLDAPLIPLVKDNSGNPIGAVMINGIIETFTGKPVTACYLKIPSGQSHTVQWAMKAPSSEKIAEMTHKCTFKFQTAYSAKAITNTYVYFADPIEVAQRLYTKKDMTLVGDNIASYGPVAVNFAPAEPQPIPARMDSEWTVFLNVRNVGEGIAEVSNLDILTASEIELRGNKILGCAGLKNINENLALFKTIKGYGASDDALVIGALNAYRCSCFDPNCPYKDPTNPYCMENLKQLVIDYDTNLCPGNMNAPELDDPVCSMTLLELIDALEDLKTRLQIQKQTTSIIPCDLTIPEGVTILSPFRFVTTADYTYYIRRDMQITTKPIKGRA
ncbi:MAG: hypothetical protein ABIF85_07090 [Nanoarchaeota archaeon]|nr:hypothetical protein [Nanoarchaeota archaeon]MBU4300542.1 hypothetical protein [Nanoarchaeota archaeon]MBU4452084.1 hypothetical protein [Nanoarchaeota archaeon]MCG2724183.1 hypothetical protein [archaeon]